MNKFILIGISILLYSNPVRANEVRNKIGAEVTESTVDSNDEVKLFYNREETLDNADILRLEVEVVLKDEERKARVKIEYEF
jgi:hypothetical protein